MITLVGILLPTLLIAGSVTNMTDFWAKELNTTNLSYEAYAGYEKLDWYFPDANIFYTYWGADSKYLIV